MSLLPPILAAAAGAAAFTAFSSWRTESTTPRALSTLFGPALRSAGLETGAGTFAALLAASAAAGDVLGMLLLPAATAPALTGFVLGLAAPIAWLLRAGGRRRTQLEAQLLPAVVQLSEALTAGKSLQDAMAVAARTGRPPLSREFARVVDDLEHGVAFEEAMRGLRTRADNEEVAFFAAAVLLQRQAGGALAETLENIAATLRERFRLRDLVRSLTAQGRLSGLLLGGLPVFLLVYMLWIVPGHVSKLWTFAAPGSLVNGLPIAICVVAEIVGFLWIRKIVTIDY